MEGWRSTAGSQNGFTCGVVRRQAQVCLSTGLLDPRGLKRTNYQHVSCLDVDEDILPLEVAMTHPSSMKASRMADTTDREYRLRATAAAAGDGPAEARGFEHMFLTRVSCAGRLLRIRRTDQVEVPLGPDPALDAHNAWMRRQLRHECRLAKEPSCNQGMMGM